MSREHVSLWYKTNIAGAQTDPQDLHLSPSADYGFLRGVYRASRDTRLR